MILITYSGFFKPVTKTTFIKRDTTISDDDNNVNDNDNNIDNNDNNDNDDTYQY